MGNKLKELRWKKNLSQKQLDIKSKVSRNTINWIEQTPEATVSIEIAEKLAKALEVEVTDIFPSYKDES